MEHSADKEPCKLKSAHLVGLNDFGIDAKTLA